MSGIDNQMAFEDLRDAIETLLNSYAPLRFRVVTEQKQSTDANEHKDTNRSIQLFFSESDFPDSGSAIQELTHDVVFQIEYTVTAKAKANLLVLNDEDATGADYEAALLAAKSAAFLANRAMDELYRMSVQILLDPVNLDQNLGLGKDGDANYLGDTRVTNFRKNSTESRGNVVSLTASARLTTSIQETFTGATPATPAGSAINILHKFNTTTDEEDATPAQTSADIDTTA